MVLIDGEIVVFDGIEFNAALSFVDVMSEIAFLLMDLEVRERPDLASIFLNRYLEETGDSEGLPLLKLYLVYRSMVRAKVAYLEHQSGGEKAMCLARYERHLALAGRYAEVAYLEHRQDRAQRGAHPAAWGITHPLGRRAQAPGRSIGRDEDRKRRGGRDVRRGDDRAHL
jgi:hypothetical protein